MQSPFDAYILFLIRIINGLLLLQYWAYCFTHSTMNAFLYIYDLRIKKPSISSFILISDNGHIAIHAVHPQHISLSANLISLSCYKSPLYQSKECILYTFYSTLILLSPAISSHKIWVFEKYTQLC